MSEKKSEKRVYPRVFLKPDKATALLKSEKDSREIAARILNVSEGGFGLGFKKSPDLKISPGEDFKVKEIIAGEDLKGGEDLILQIVWVLDHDGLSSCGAGCSFKRIDGSYREKVSSFVKKKLGINL